MGGLNYTNIVYFSEVQSSFIHSCTLTMTVIGNKFHSNYTKWDKVKCYPLTCLYPKGSNNYCRQVFL